MDSAPLEEQQLVSNPVSNVSTRSEYSNQKGKKAVGFVLFLILLVLGGGTFFYLVSLQSRVNQSNLEESPEPFVVQESEPLPTPTEEAKKEEVIDKKSISISVLNGTGITGEAAYLQDKLEDLGYTSVKVGNASSQNYKETVVKFSSTLSRSVVDEITAELNKIYNDVRTQTVNAESFDVEIITGLRLEQTSRPTTSSTPTPKVTTTPISTRSPSPTP